MRPSPTHPVPSRVDYPPLVALVDYHGCWLPGEAARSVAAALGISPSTLKKHISRHLDALESGWTMVGYLTPSVVDAIVDAPDGVEAYANLRSHHIAPPTQRAFYARILFSRDVPELAVLRAREMSVMNQMTHGLGRRACAACAAYFGAAR